jgi:hypothetical protein
MDIAFPFRPINPIKRQRYFSNYSGLRYYVAHTTTAIVSNPIKASKTLWAQRAIDASMFDLQKNVADDATQVLGCDFCCASMGADCCMSTVTPIGDFAANC